MAKRELALEDIAALVAAVGEAAGAEDGFAAAAAIARETCGFRLLTVLRYDEAAAEVVRVYSSDPAYPPGGRKALSQYPAIHAAMGISGVCLSGTREAVRRAFADHARLLEMGITAILNAQIRHAGRRLGTLNLSGIEGQYGERETEIARLLAGLLAPLLLAAGRRP